MSLDKYKGENKVKQDTQDRKDTWGRLICDAEAQIKLAQKRIGELRKSIRFFAKQRESGAQFPLQK
jgi:hypothetical protein